MRDLLNSNQRVLKEFEYLGQTFKVVKSEGKYYVTWHDKIIWVMTYFKSSQYVVDNFKGMLDARGYTEEELINNLNRF
jgi:hypothetical protein